MHRKHSRNIPPVALPGICDLQFVLLPGLLEAGMTSDVLR